MSKVQSDSDKLICYHCGLTCVDNSIAIGDKLFCCNGCKTAYEILEGSDLCKFYDLNQAPGSTPTEFGFKEKFNFLEDENTLQQLYQFVNEDIATNAAIAGSKINPVFTANMSTTGTLFVTNSITTGTDGQVHPDYVFQKYFLGNSILNTNYKFSNLGEIENFIITNHHLPGVQSAAAVKEQGFWNLGEASRINLEKIEELFLHTIEQEKKITDLTSENKELANTLESLQKDVAAIKLLLATKSSKE